MSRKQRRLTLIGIAGLVIAFAGGLVLYALSDRITLFNTPTELAAKTVPDGARIRLGGLVVEGSVEKATDGAVKFAVTDGNAIVPVAYTGFLPDLFSEGQGVVAEGVLMEGGVFEADTVLAKHDEQYMPREVVDALKEQGVWQHDPSAPPGS